MQNYKHLIVETPTGVLRDKCNLGVACDALRTTNILIIQFITVPIVLSYMTLFSIFGTLAIQIRVQFFYIFL